MWGNFRNQFQGTFHQTDIALAIAVIGIVLLLVIPLPPFLLDLLLCINIVFSVMVLLLTLYVEHALEFSAFPAAILFLTLYRLGLNIAVTRMILTHAEAGDIVRTFGEFVTEGHVGVGLILFALLTTINFVVVTKGAGRVAEVAARFTLEALPGKQMTIDAELNAGLIQHAEAKGQHQRVQQEAEFYGAMDGASKFVRGDAIAGILMICVNIFGGFIVGLSVKGFSLHECWSLFTRLTVGEGLVSQIPALLVSIGAAIMVTRCSAQSLGQALSKQLFHHPKVLTITGVLLLILGLVPGMPLIVMGPIAAILLVYASTLFQQTKERAHQGKGERIIVHVSVGASLARRLSDVKEEIALQLKQFTEEMGVQLPRLVLADQLGLSPSAFEVKFEGEVVHRGRCESQELPHHVAQVVSRHCHELLSRHDVAFLIEQARRVDATMVNELIPKYISVGEVTAILQNLLKEHVSIRHFSMIIESLTDAVAAGCGKEVDRLTQKVRERLGRRISDQLFGKTRTAYIITLDPKVEKMIEVTLSHPLTQVQERLRPQMIEKIAQQLLLLQQKSEQQGGKAVVLTESALRSRLKRLIEQQLPDLPVLAYSEVSRDVKLETIGMVTREILLP